MQKNEREQAEKRRDAVIAEITRQYGEDAPFVLATPDGFSGAGKDYETRGLAENLLDYVCDVQEKEKSAGIKLKAMEINNASDLDKLPKEVRDIIVKQTDCGDPDCEVHGGLQDGKN